MERLGDSFAANNTLLLITKKDNIDELTRKSNLITLGFRSGICPSYKIRSLTFASLGMKACLGLSADSHNKA